MRKTQVQINNLIMHLKVLEKQEKSKSEINGRKEIINITVKMNEIETKK